MKKHKIIFSGPVGSGKTTAIGAVSDVPPVRTEQFSNEYLPGKTNTTVAMDYGAIHLDNNETVYLYGTPGQSRFDFMWDILVRGAIGIVLLINNSAPDPLQDLEYFLNAFDRFIREHGLVVGVTHMDKMPKPDLNSYHGLLRRYQTPPPLFEVNARDPDDVRLLLQAMLYSLDATLVETEVV